MRHPDFFDVLYCILKACRWEVLEACMKIFNQVKNAEFWLFLSINLVFSVRFEQYSPHIVTD